MLVNILAHLDRERWHPRVIFQSPGPFADDVAAMGIPVRVVAGSDPPRPGAADAGMPAPRPENGFRRSDGGACERSGLRRLAWEARASWRRRVTDIRAGVHCALLVDGEVDLIHVNAPMHGDYAWFHAARALRAPFLTHEHEVWKTPPTAYRPVARAAASVLCLAPERMLQVSAFCRGRVRVELLPNGIAVDELVPRRSRAEVRAEFGIGEARVLIVTAGHLQEWKGQMVAVEAAGLLREAGRPFTWILPGAPVEPRYAERLRERIGELGLGDCVVLAGERSDLPDLFAAADLAAHTSIRPEPFGLVVIEAMLQGIPVIGPAEGSIPALVQDGQDGLLYEPRDAVSLAGAVTRLMNDDDLRRRLGTAARRRVRAEFDVRLQVRRLESIYSRILGDTEGRPRRAGRIR